MYQIIRPLLFSLDAERGHDLIIALLSILSRNKTALRWLNRRGIQQTPSLPCTLAGLHLPNPLGLAAGLDKNAQAFPALAALGFGWLELGTVTPKPQPGNPKKRLYRIPSEAALINRMGFNSGGLEPFIQNVKRLRQNTNAIIGINIGRNARTPTNQSVEDYLVSLDAVYGLADYVAINVSSPNTKTLRELQEYRNLNHLVDRLIIRRNELATHHDRTIPLFLKIAPDLDPNQIEGIADIAIKYKLEGIIATNTTVSRPDSLIPEYQEEGGLSGRPLRKLSTQTISQLRQFLESQIPVIGVGGIESKEDVKEKIQAGATLVQIYTSLIYQGPAIIRRILRGLEQDMKSMHINDWSSLVERIHSS
ncbi:MAG: quinone-dependent dihydroorotate dehydrogenase [Arenicellales bacterium]|nr:quinone-dependent dihydroorotate dehydrogenase [Arenicellales bacterium]